MNNIEYNWIKAHHELAGDVMVRPINKDGSEFVSQDGYIYLVKDLDFTDAAVGKDERLELLGWSIVNLLIGRGFSSRNDVIRVFAEYMKEKDVDEVMATMLIPTGFEENVRNILKEAKDYYGKD